MVRIIAFSSILLLSIVGCHTVYLHPTVFQKIEVSHLQQLDVRYYNDCSSCHSSAELDKFNYFTDNEIEKAHGESFYADLNRGKDFSYFYEGSWWNQERDNDEYIEIYEDDEVIENVAIISEPTIIVEYLPIPPPSIVLPPVRPQPPINPEHPQKERIMDDTGSSSRGGDSSAGKIRNGTNGRSTKTGRR